MNPDATSSRDISAAARIATRIRRSLLAWFDAHRRALPWRGTTDPYTVWISEVMLQQTQAQTAIPYFEKWMRRFPTVESLADARLEEVLRLWAGLGYYARARNLHAAARAIVQRHGGLIPVAQKDLQALPGIGRYTAGAILSIAFGLPAPILDANAIRVLSRLFMVEGDPRKGVAHRRLWDLAGALVPDDRPGEFNQAVMELGAMVCTPDAPECDACPLAAFCQARVRGCAADLPRIPRGPETIREEHVSAVVRRDGQVLLVQRVREGLWGGLWECPRAVRAPGESLEECARRAAREATGIEIRAGARLGTIRHTVTHHRIALHAVEGHWISGTPRASGCENWCWTSLEEAVQRPLSAPQARLLDMLRSNLIRRSQARDS